MQMRRALAIAALSAHSVIISAQDLSSLSECSVKCYNSVIASGLACDSGDNACLCANQNFGFGLRDCAVQACTAEDVTQLASFSEALCAATATTPTPSVPPPVTPTPPVEAPPPPTIVSSVQSSPQQAPSPSTNPPEGGLPSGSPSISSGIAAQETNTVTTMSTVTTSEPSSTNVPVAPGSTDSQQSDKDKQEGEGSGENGSPAALTTPAIIGIGVGAGVAAIGSGLALFLLLRRRRNTRVRSLQISDPMPGSGRDYSGGLGSLYDKNLTELELKSKRYEDMIPRQSPRSMI